ncbi:hypothetical protein A3860_38240 [Niastella vici]|uniref:FecR protein domain-containing protein n=1 Tax=Niastella vici TaxID=1703345 RepID=A0A1V9FLJ9_9BACT|nr:FecR family protein [Niastella vici]OQP59224.1 hypothetical protein A3860_38240 [Niastella vici]
METHKTIAEYILKYQTNSLNEQEWQALQEWINRSERNRKLFKRLSDKAYWEKVRKIDLEKEWQKVIDTYPAKQIYKLSGKSAYIYIAAACILLLVGAGYLFLYKSKNTMPQAMHNNSATNPYLQLAGGSTMELNGSVTGPVACINGQEVRNKNRQIRFDPTSNSDRLGCNNFYADFLYNTLNVIITPKGSIYFITLPDGTEVTLNEGSVLKFPSVFNPYKRVVELSGEAYFDVKHCYSKVTGKKVPFIVEMHAMEVGVLGTQFDVKSFNGGDSIKTTLVKGSVRLKANSRECLLEPGKAVVLNNNGEFSRQTTANLDEVNAWRASARFDNAPIEEIMEHISRVFGITVTYKNKTSRRFSTYIPATSSLTVALGYVELARGLKFRTVGKNVVVEFVNQ